MATLPSLQSKLAAAMLLLLSVTFSGPSAAAIYKLTFTGTFNDNDVEGSIHNRASFTELIGATHTAGNLLWQPGVLATIGIENVAEQGEGAELEIEINNAINTGTAASMFITDFLEDFPDVTSIVIEVPDTHTYITAISMVAPSPDWFIGVYDLALQSGGNWIADLTVDLMPWDAGTEEGDTFSLSNPASNPHIPVAPPADSPFIGSPVIGTLHFELITPTKRSVELLNWKPLLKDSVPGNPGLESIIPLINLTDADADGVNEKVVLAYNVWAVGTNTKLFKTVKRRIDLTVPCMDPVSGDSDVELKFLDETGSRSHMIFTVGIFCTESGTLVEKTAYKTIVYSADVSRSPGEGGDSWVKSWNKEALSFDLVDWDDDAQKEIILTLLVEQDTSEDIRVIALDPSNGTKEADNKYRIANEF